MKGMCCMKKGRSRIMRLCIAIFALLALTCVCMVGFATQVQPVEGPVCYNHGDINADGAIDSRDAVYTLYHYLFGEEEYPVQQDWDFNKDNSLDSSDAVYLLYAYNFSNNPNYQLDGVVHNYYDPTWQWGENSAVATFKCGCGESQLLLDESDGVVVEQGEGKAATCVLAGSTVYTAKVTLNGQTYTASKTTTVPARVGGHKLIEGNCTTETYCEFCDYTVAAPGHKWETAADLSSEATCTANAVQGFRCASCNETKTVEQENTAGHELQYAQDVAKENCLYVKQYHCTICDQDFDGETVADSYYKHTYKATLTMEATCKQQGEKTYVCTECGDQGKTEPVPTNDSHKWDDGVTAGGVTTYTCADCGETKTAVVVAAEQAVSKEELGSAQELQLGNDTSMKLDESVVENLDAERDVKISADALSEQKKEEISNLLTEEQKAQIGDNTVYDFSMVYADNNDKVEFNGKITVSLPYTLQPGEDVDSIDVWYIADDGTLERVDGTYSNGFVTFTTDHFSYYTVTRLTAAERCERYGHIPVESQKAASCTEDGYTMSECQRCMKELSKQIHSRTGHSYTTATTAATCEKDGSVVKTCGNCGNTVAEVIPALGHNMVLDQSKSTAASCTAAGKNTYVCSNAGCDNIREDAVAQLAHAYVADTPVIADCTNKGIATKTCGDCGDVVVISETAPLGHSFAADSAVWGWSNDYSSATVTLYCVHDKAHTKVLNAVVTETVVTPTCEGDGSVTYSAAASFNNITYTDEKVITENAPGHNPGAQWQNDKNQHYHICTVCEKKVDTAGHNWNNGTVIQQATCAESGKMEVQCTVCSFKQERVIAATGNHDYVDGVCSVCGQGQHDCDHIIKSETQLDLSAYNVCEGTDIRIYGCECKQEASLRVYNFACQSTKTEYVEKILPNGDAYEVEVVTCNDCGLVLSSADYEVITEAPCQVAIVVEYSISVGETEIIQMKYNGYTEHHPGVTVVSTTELTKEEYGLCGITLRTQVCPCGERIYTYQYYDGDCCDWDYIDFDNEDGIRTWQSVCYHCGAIQVNQDWHTPTDVTCEYLYTDTYTYYFDGEEIYSYTNTSTTTIHDYKLVKHQLYGDSCYDGVLLEFICNDCGKDHKYFSEYHEAVIETEIDLTAENVCFDGIVQQSCPCGGYQDTEFWGEECVWGPLVEGESSICSVCGVTVESKTTVTRDEQCNATYFTTHVYADKDGKEIARVYSRYDQVNHNNKRTYELQGKSCEDGIWVMDECEDCGYSDKYLSYGHMTQCIGYYNLEDYGMCPGSYEVYLCPCGEVSWHNTNFSCNSASGDADRYWDETGCSNCQVSRRNYYEPIEQIDMCHVIRKNGYEFIKDGVVILDATFERIGMDHDFVYTATLMPGAVDCYGGVNVVEYCKNCDYEESWQNHGHETYTLSSNIYGEGVLCGPMEVREYSCACGLRSGIDCYFISDNYCEYGPNRWSDTFNDYVSTCQKCGSIFKYTETRIPVEGETCQYHANEIYTYYSMNAEELFSYERNHIITSCNQIAEFDMLGETCDDGYYISWYCQDCGRRSDDPNLRYGCTWYTLSVEKIFDGKDSCGPMYIGTNGCGCGSLHSRYIDYNNCRVDDLGYDQKLQMHMHECATCGLVFGSRTYDESSNNSCTRTRVDEYRFFRDGEEVGQYSKAYTDWNHTWLHSYVLNGATCEDGYTMIRTCYFCDATETDSGYYDHEAHLVDYYDLSSYGLCGSDDNRDYIAFYSCACGKESYINSRICCDWNHVDYDQDTGISQYYCDGCGYTWYYCDRTALDTNTCTETGTYRAWCVRDGVTVLSIEKPIAGERHETVLTNVVLNNPDQGCEGGYIITKSCVYCDYTDSYEDYGHDLHAAKIVNLSQMGACGGQFIYRQCACGKYSNVDSGWDCEMSYEYTRTGTQRNGTEIRTRICRKCGLKIVEECVTTTPDGSCFAEKDYVITITMGDKSEVMQYSVETELHVYQRANAVFDQEDGNCEGGFTAYMICATCGDSYSYHGYDHVSEYMAYIDLGEMGACTGRVELRGCACGSNIYQNNGWDCDMSYHIESTGDDRNGTHTEIATCRDCGLKIVMEDVWTTPEGSCYSERSTTVTAIFGDKEESFTYSKIDEAHDYFRTGATFDVEGGDCNSGYTAYLVCADCGVSSSYHSYDHNYENIERVDLDELGACGGSVTIRGCACGYSCSIDEKYDCDMTSAYKNGQNYDMHIESCAKCGLEVETRRDWYRPDNTCLGYDDYKITITIGDAEEVMTYRVNVRYHTYEYKYELSEGSSSCTDGLKVYYYCIYCGYTQTGETYNHNKMLVDSIDLTKYGSVCGGVLNHYACPCGAEQHYAISEDDACDWDEQHTSMWIKHDLDEGQYTTSGWQACWTYSYMYTCAVTNPACGMKIRMAEYWVKDGCEAKQYETWQIGYDEKTGECAYEFTIATGRKCAFHQYVASDVNEILEDGRKVTGTLEICKDCGSSYCVQNYYLNDIWVMREEFAVNTLDNGERKEYRYIDEYDYDLYVQYGVEIRTNVWREYVGADGSKSWERYSYQYDFTNGCKKIYTFTNSNGYINTYEESGHISKWSRTRTNDPTCTQHGLDTEEYRCTICNHVENIYYYDVDPTAHNWRWNHEKEIYCCGTCGLENVFGASGAIVLEDLTESYGNGTDYVIGYWDRGDVDFGLYISLIPEGADGDEEVVLEGIEFVYLTVEKDGIRAVSCDVEAVAQAIGSLGQAGGYSIRINFVPMSGEHDLDYAITLTDVAAQ